MSKLPLILLFLTLTALLNTSCSSIRSRTERPADQWTVYPGVQRDIADLEAAFEGKFKGPAWTAAVVTPFLLADLPFSAAFDTLALPYDGYRQSENPPAKTP